MDFARCKTPSERAGRRLKGQGRRITGHGPPGRNLGGFRNPHSDHCRSTVTRTLSLSDAAKKHKQALALRSLQHQVDGHASECASDGEASDSEATASRYRLRCDVAVASPAQQQEGRMGCLHGGCLGIFIGYCEAAVAEYFFVSTIPVVPPL